MNTLISSVNKLSNRFYFAWQASPKLMLGAIFASTCAGVSDIFIVNFLPFS